MLLAAGLGDVGLSVNARTLIIDKCGLDVRQDDVEIVDMLTC